MPSIPHDDPQSSPNLDAEIRGGSDNKRHEWLMGSLNQLAEDNRSMNQRIDQVFSHLADSKNDASLACSVARLETTLAGIEGKVGKLDNIEKTILKTKTTIAVATSIIVACAGFTWWLFGSYFSKMIAALNLLVDTI
jgi:hypothetical protein